MNEHIIAKKWGGSDSLNNIANACSGCNGHKHDRIKGLDEETNEIVPLFNPRTNTWTEHFGWSKNYLTIIGFTPIGRVTINFLKMNRPLLINLRTILILSGEHPKEN